ncbi:ANKRD50 [Symbiodinium sp. CCMP2592]|nr:ANKRD50 [Symbiodinium sp. CCMP2592]
MICIQNRPQPTSSPCEAFGSRTLIDEARYAQSLDTSRIHSLADGGRETVLAAHSPPEEASCGSRGHPHLCKRPCLFLVRGRCSNGAQCNCCHMPHARRPAMLMRRSHRQEFNLMGKREALLMLHRILTSNADRNGFLPLAKESLDLVAEEAMKHATGEETTSDYAQLRLERVLVRMPFRQLAFLSVSKANCREFGELMVTCVEKLTDDFEARREIDPIPRRPHGRELEVEGGPGFRRLQESLEIDDFLLPSASIKEKQEKMAKMLQRLVDCHDTSCMVLLYHYTSIENARSILKEGFALSDCNTFGPGIYFTELPPTDAECQSLHWEENLMLNVFGAGWEQRYDLEDLAVVIVELPKTMVRPCGARTWFCPKVEAICHHNHRLQSHIKKVAFLTRWVSLRWCLTGKRFHTIPWYVACDKPDFIGWLRNYLHENFRLSLRLSYYATKLMVDLPGSEGARTQRECPSSGTWEELQKPSQIYVYQAVPQDFPEYRDLLHSSETSELESALWAGQDPNCVDARGQTAAWKASRNGNLESLHCLNKANADFDIPEPWTQILIAFGGDKRGASPVFAASDKGNVAVVRFLLDCGASVNRQVSPGTHVAIFASALYAGCQNGNLEIVETLLGALADVNERTADGATALMVAAQNGNEKVFSRVLAACDTTSINLEDPTGLTALYFGAQNGYTGIVCMLLKAGASTQVRSQDGATPLFKAAQNGHQEVVVPLLQHRADVFAAAHDGTTPLILAAYKGHVSVVDVLVPEIINRAGVKGLDISMQSSGATAMFVAAQAGKDGIVRKLGLFGADAQKSLASGACPIHIAAKLGHLNVLKELLDAKADVDARGPDGITALDLASKNGHIECANHLLKLYAEALENGQTAHQNEEATDLSCRKSDHLGHVAACQLKP